MVSIDREQHIQEELLYCYQTELDAKTWKKNTQSCFWSKF